jgi:hypothetical protein
MRVRTAAKRHTSGMLSGRQIILMDDGTRGVSRGLTGLADRTASAGTSHPGQRPTGAVFSS